MKDLRILRTKDKDLERIQQFSIEFVNQFKNNPSLNGIHFTEIEINTTLSLSHKLNRIPLGYIVTKKSADTNIWDTAIDDKTISLVSSVSVVIDLWVF